MKVVKIFIVVAIATLISSSMFNACSKEESLDKDNNLYVQKQEKWNPGEDYPFIVKDNPPFEYAVYQEDAELLLSYIKSVLKNQKVIQGENLGYFILRFGVKDKFINYGFLAESMYPYYHLYNPIDPSVPDIPLINDPEEIENEVKCLARIRTKDENKLDLWTERQVARGRTRISVTYVNGVWNAEAHKPK
jgi:hypothetical protein